MQEVTLQQILDARESRVALQKSLLNKYKAPLVCFTMNIAGPIKTSPLIERAFYDGVKVLQSKLPQKSILHKEIDVSVTGCQAMFCVSVDAQKLKTICTEIEDSCSVGRLFDMDVLDTSGKKLNRQNLRGCIVCGRSGRECAAGRLHSVQEIQEVTQKIITDHFFYKDCERFSNLATQSLLDEVYTTPKPGLVDRRNNGSHKDMDVNAFVKSARSLTPYFSQCVKIGYETSNQPPAYTFQKLREAGVAAEATMYKATGGVNTHKGAVYSFGIILGALGRLYKCELEFAGCDKVLSLCSDMCKEAVKSDFLSIDNTTAGGRLYLEHKLTGIRGEAASGFRSVKNIGLPVYQRLIDSGFTSNDAGAVTLLHLISAVQDTNLYHRGGSQGAEYAAASAKRLLSENPTPSKEQTEKLDDDFISRNLSPGGCADILAVTYFLFKLNLEK